MSEVNEMNIELGVVAEKSGKIVSEPSIARKLLKDGYRIIDIKPKRGMARESVFVFSIEGDFINAFAKYKKERKERKSNKEE